MTDQNLEDINILDTSSGVLTYLAIDNSTNTLSGISTANCNGESYTKSFDIYDPHYTHISVTLNFVTLKDDSPTLSIGSIPTITCYEGITCTWDLNDYFTDEEGDAITYNSTTCNQTIDNIAFDSATGVYSGVPLLASVSSNPVE